MVLGRTGLARKGEWIASVAYDTLDIVTYEGKVYISKRASAGSEPSSESSDWVAIPGAPSFEIEETASGYDLTITGSDGTSETISILNGEVDREELEDALEAFRASTDAYLAPDYDDTATYSIGDSCIHDGRLYRCIVNIPVAELWTIGHWEPVVLADTIAQMRKDAVVKADVVVNSAEPGEVVSFDDGADDVPVKELVVGVEPVQNLNGQANPYPPGGGTNMLSDQNGTYTEKTSGNMYFVNGMTLPAGTYYVGRYKKEASTESTGIYLKIGSGSASRLGQNEGQMYIARSFTLEEESSVSLYLSSSVTGGYYRFMLSKSVLTNGQNDFAPYSNVCPISGWTGVEVTRSGKNLYDKSNLVNGYTNASLEFVSDSSARATGLIPINGQCTFSAKRTSTAKVNDSMLRIVTFDENKQIIARTLSAQFEANAVSKMSVNDPNARFVKAELFVGSNIVDTAILELGSSATDYEPYTGQSYPISWQSEAGTVYGGSLDLTTGVLTIDLSLWNGSWDLRESGSNTPWIRLGGTFPSGNLENRSKWWFNKGKVIATSGGAVPTGNIIYGLWHYNTSSARIFLPAGSVQADATAFMDGTQILYPRVTPLTYQLTPTQIETFLGQNNFWSNGNGTLDLEYRADTKLYIQQLTKPTEDDMIANANIASGKFFMVGNRLFLSTTAIAQGEQIAVGANCIRKSLADALNDLHD